MGGLQQQTVVSRTAQLQVCRDSSHPTFMVKFNHFTYKINCLKDQQNICTDILSETLLPLSCILKLVLVEWHYNLLRSKVLCMWKFHILHLPKISAKSSAIPRYVGDLDIKTVTASGWQRSISLFRKRCPLDRDQQIQVLTDTQVAMEQRVSQIAQSSCALHRETGTWHLLYNVTMLTRTQLGALLVKGKGVLKPKEN